MSFNNHDSKKEVNHEEFVPVEVLEEKNRLGSAVLVDSNLMNDAYAGENREHEMGIMESLKAHPMACLWAFVFCFTIVGVDAR